MYRYVTLNESTKDLVSFGVHTAQDLIKWARTINMPGQSKTKATSKGWPVTQKVGWQNLLIALCEAETVIKHYKSNLKFVVDVCKAWRKTQAASPLHEVPVPVVDDVNGQSVAIQYVTLVVDQLGMKWPVKTRPKKSASPASGGITPRKAVEELIMAELLLKLGWPCTADLAAAVELVTRSLKLVQLLFFGGSRCANISNLLNSFCFPCFQHDISMAIA